MEHWHLVIPALRLIMTIWSETIQDLLPALKENNLKIRIVSSKLVDFHVLTLPYHNWVNKSAGGLNQPTLFSNVHFSMKKGVWRPQILWLFLIHYKLSDNPKNFLVFHSVLGWSRSNIQKPRPIRVKYLIWIDQIGI